MKKFILSIGIICLLMSVSQAQDSITIIKLNKEKSAVNLKVTDYKDMSVYIDGRKYDYHIMEILDKNKIESIEILRGVEANEKYDNENIILITSKKNTGRKIITLTKDDKDSVIINDRKIRINTKGGLNGEGSPVIIVDGEIQDESYIKNIDPDQIESIQVLKDKKSMKKYKTKNGVIIVSLKKEKK